MIPPYLTPMRDCRMMALKCLSLCLKLFRVRNLTRDYHVITMVTIQVSSTQVRGLGFKTLVFSHRSYSHDNKLGSETSKLDTS